MTDQELRLALASTSPPDETGAERRAWSVVRAAFDEREPAPKRGAYLRPALALAAVVAIVAAVLSPPGRAVLDDIRDAIAPTRIEPSEAALVRLPAPGRLLVNSSAGTWVVRRDGSKRLLGPYREASWSPNGLFVAATRRRELAAVTPDGDVRWSVARTGPISSPQWTGSRVDTRIAYLDGRSLRIVAGDGTGDRVLDRRAVALAWRPVGSDFVLAYLQERGRLVVRNADSGRVLWRARVPGGRRLVWSPDGGRLVVIGADALHAFAGGGRRVSSRALPRVSEAAFAPDGRRLAVTRRLGDGRSETAVVNRDLSSTTRILLGAGDYDGLAWSPDGRWLLVGWRSANQWLFQRVEGRARTSAYSDMAAQFSAGSDMDTFPRVAPQGWCCAP